MWLLVGLRVCEIFSGLSQWALIRALELMSVFALLIIFLAGLRSNNFAEFFEAEHFIGIMAPVRSGQINVISTRTWLEFGSLARVAFMLPPGIAIVVGHIC